MNFHEALCRESFKNKPVHGDAKGCKAQRALLNGGTLANGKVHVKVRMSHGRVLRELVAGKRFEPGEDVTCYGGWLLPAPRETDKHTYMRHIPLTDYVLDGLEFSNQFPSEGGAGLRLGYSVALRPTCEDRAWEDVIASTGIGYMANTTTACPQQQRARPNVTICQAMLGRLVTGVPYPSVVVLRASANGIDEGDAIISPYEAYKLTGKFAFKCMDRNHYAMAGRLDQYVPEPEGNEDPIG